MEQSAIYPDIMNIDLITSLPTFANDVSNKIARSECNAIPCFAEIQFADWDSLDLMTAFANAREQISRVTGPGETAFHTLAGQDIRRKWCIPSQFHSFQGLHTWAPNVVKVLLFDIWRDLMWVKYDGLDDIIIGVTVSAYDKSQYNTSNPTDAARKFRDRNKSVRILLPTVPEHNVS